MKIDNIVSYSMLSMIMLIFLVFLYWSFWPETVITFCTSKFIDPPSFTIYNGDSIPKYKPGDEVSIEFEYRKYKQLQAQLSRKLVKIDEPNIGTNVAVIVHNSLGNAPVGHHSRIFMFVIPLSTPNGIYKLQTTVVYDINPIRSNYQMQWETMPFMVEK